MAIFILETDAVTSAGSTISSLASQMESIASSISGYDTTCEDGFDFAGAKDAIAKNAEALTIKFQNSQNILDSVVSSHTELQSSLQFGGDTVTDAGTPNSQPTANDQGSSNTGGNYTGSYSGSYSGNYSGSYSGGGSNSSNSSSSSASAKIRNATTDKSLQEALSLAGISTAEMKINGSPNGFTSVKVDTKDGEKQFDIFEQTQFTQWSNGGWNLSDNGCAVCSVTTIIRAYGDDKYKDATPSDIINEGHGGVPFNFFADGIKDTLSNCGVDFEQVNYGPNDAAAMVEQLKKGTPMIVSVRGNGQQYANSSGHTIVLLGMTEDGKVMIGDSYSAFNGSTVYTKEVNEIFSVMCNDPCNSYDTKEVLVINGNKNNNTSSSKDLLSSKEKDNAVTV